MSRAMPGRATYGLVLVCACLCLVGISEKAFAAPANDNFANAQDLGVATTFSVTGDTTSATREGGEPGTGGAGHTIWYKWRAPFTRAVQLNTINRQIGQDFIINVFTANNPINPAVNALTVTGGSGTDSTQFGAVANTQYFIQIDAANSDGSVNLNLPLPPANDSVAAAIDLGGSIPFAVAGDTTGATQEANEPANGQGFTVWYKWRSPGTGTVRINTRGSNIQTALQVFTSTLVPPTFGNPFAVPPAPSSLTLVGSGGVSTQFPITNGTTYFIQVDTTGVDPGTFFLSMTPSPVNDAFANATNLQSQTSFTVFGDNTGATTEPQEIATGAGATIWWKWLAPFNRKIQFDTNGSAINAKISVFTGSSVNALTIAPFITSNGNVYQFNAVNGSQYSIRVDGQTASDLGAVQLNFTVPANDNFANAQLLTGPSFFNIPGDNTNATKENGEPNHGGNAGGASVWYSWTSPISGNVALTQNGPVRHSLAVYVGGAVTSLALVAQSGPSFNSSVTFNAVAGTTYKIAIDGQNGTFGTFAISLAPPPSNDAFASAITLTGLPVSVTGSNVGATTEGGEPASAGSGATVWYKWTAPVSGNVIVGTAGALNSVIDVYTGIIVSGLTKVATGNFAATLNAISGTTYMIRIDSNGATGSFQLLLQVPPPNDNFANATALTGSTFDVAGYNLGATLEAGEPVLGLGNTVWWSWTSPASVHVSLSTTGSTFTTVLKVFTGTAVNALTPVISSNTDKSSFTFDATQGTVYKILVDSAASSFPGSIQLGLRTAPANDNFANAIALGGSAPTAMGSNFAATKETGEPNHNGIVGGQSVWYAWTAPASGNAQVTIANSDPLSTFRPVIGVYTGTAVGALTTVASGTVGIPATFTATNGTVYNIAVDGAGSGTFTLNIAVAPANDNFTNAIAINGYSTVNGNNQVATKETGEPAHAGNSGGASVWWKFVAPDTRKVEVTTAGSNFDTLLGVYTGTAVNALTLAGSNDNETPTIVTSKVQFNATAGTTYFIAVDGSGGATGNIVLTVRRADVAITSPLTVSPTPQVAGKPVTFTVVTDAPATFLWDFGDGTKETSPVGTITHVYTVPGPYNVTVTAQLENGFTTSSTLTITVLGSRDLGVSALSITLDFVKKKDTIKGGGFMNLADSTVSGPITIRVGAVEQVLTLTGNGTFKSAKSKTQSQTVTLKAAKGAGSNIARYTYTFIGSFQTALAPLGMTKDNATKKPIIVPVQIIFNGLSHQFNVPVFYTSKGTKGNTSLK